MNSKYGKPKFNTNESFLRGPRDVENLRKSALAAGCFNVNEGVV